MRRIRRGPGHPLCEHCGAPLRESGAACARCGDEPGTGTPNDPALGVSDVRVHIGRWVLHGAFVVRSEGFYIFIREAVCRRRLFRGLARQVIDPFLGLLGGLFVRAAAAVVEDAEVGLPRGAKRRMEFTGRYEKAVDQAPDILCCDHCLFIPKGDVHRLVLRGGGFAEFKAGGREFEVWGDFSAVDAPAFLSLRGYQFDRVGFIPAGRLAFVGALTVLGFVSFGAELIELGQLSRTVGPKVARGIELFGDSGVHHTSMVDGKRLYIMNDGRELPSEALPLWFRIWHNGREVIVLTVLGAIILYFAVRQVRERYY